MVVGAATTAGDEPSDLVHEWWETHFGAGAPDTVAFDRMRAAAESEIGPLSSVDVQLLRLELSDERGKLTKLALRRMVAGYDGSAGYGHP